MDKHKLAPINLARVFGCELDVGGAAHKTEQLQKSIADQKALWGIRAQRQSQHTDLLQHRDQVCARCRAPIIVGGAQDQLSKSRFHMVPML